MYVRVYTYLNEIVACIVRILLLISLGDFLRDHTISEKMICSVEDCGGTALNCVCYRRL